HRGLVRHPGGERRAVAGVGVAELGQCLPDTHAATTSRASGASVVRPGANSAGESRCAVHAAMASALAAPIWPLGVFVIAVLILGGRMTTVRRRGRVAATQAPSPSSAALAVT